MNTNRNARILGLFSGFPEHHFNDAIEEVLQENLPKRDSIVFISADPENYAQNDDDRDGMHEMFAERKLAFAEKHVIDRRTSAEEAVKLVREADCIWLMGGESTLQIRLIRDLGLDTELRESKAVILGVSAGSMNLGRTVAYIWDDAPYWYEALGFTNITIKAHYKEGDWFIPRLLEMSMTHPIVAMEDMSAIFVRGDEVWKVGKMYLVDKGQIDPITDEDLKALR
ncbi:MAG: Type 1 glutamine amidotransferase-like domain-containing protein [Lachnospiraceae bacterium]|nr:Type 1 glutamine amidotransferase-like domain-containing protein [Lachnospiraceae bacterium]